MNLMTNLTIYRYVRVSLFKLYAFFSIKKAFQFPSQIANFKVFLKVLIFGDINIMSMFKIIA